MPEHSQGKGKARVQYENENCNVSDPGIELDDGACDSEKVLSDYVGPSAKS